MTVGSNLAAGSRITAALLRSMTPSFAFKGSSQSVTSSTTLVNDSALFLNLIPVNTVWLFECVLSYAGGTAGSSDLKIAFSVPTGATMNYQVTGQAAGSGLLPTTGYVRGASGVAVGTNGSGNTYAVSLTGTLSTSNVAGSLQLQWAQNTSSATPTILMAGSFMSLLQIQ